MSQRILTLEMGGTLKALFTRLGVTPAGLMDMTPAEFDELMYEDEPKPEVELGTLEHLKMVNRKLTSEGKPPMAPGWLWPDVPTSKPGMKPAKAVKHG